MSFTKARSAYANGVRSNLPQEELGELRTAMAAERLAEHIERVVAQAPPLTAEQRDRLALLLRPSASPSAGDAA
ncbi:MAG: hypothetical protein U0Q19_17020 [Kineosporiaceae bacterium]